MSDGFRPSWGRVSQWPKNFQKHHFAIWRDVLICPWDQLAHLILRKTNVRKMGILFWYWPCGLMNVKVILLYLVKGRECGHIECCDLVKLVIACSARQGFVKPGDWRLRKGFRISISDPIFPTKKHKLIPMDLRKYLSGSVGEGSVFVPCDVLFCPLLCVRVRSNFYQLWPLFASENCLGICQVEEVNLKNGNIKAHVCHGCNWSIFVHCLLITFKSCGHVRQFQILHWKIFWCTTGIFLTIIEQYL